MTSCAFDMVDLPAELPSPRQTDCKSVGLRLPGSNPAPATADQKLFRFLIRRVSDYAHHYEAAALPATVRAQDRPIMKSAM